MANTADAWRRAVKAVPDVGVVEVSSLLGVSDSHRRRWAGPLKAKRTFQRLQETDVDHRRRRVVVKVIRVRRHGNEHLQL